MNSKDFTIGILSTTAVILLVGLLLIHSRPAVASGMTATAGRFILTVGTVQTSNEELLYVIDTVEMKMIGYRFNAAKKQIEPAFGQDLGDLIDKAANKAGKPGQGRRRP